MDIHTIWRVPRSMDLEAVQRLDLSLTYGLDLQELAASIFGSKLLRLDIDSVEAKDVTPIAVALRFTMLQSLSMQRNLIADVSSLADALSVNKTLRCLSLRGNMITNVGRIGRALTLSVLEVLDLGNNRIVDADEIADALPFCSLKRLDLELNSLRSAAAFRKAAKVSDILYIFLAGNDLISADEAQAIDEVIEDRITLQWTAEGSTTSPETNSSTSKTLELSTSYTSSSRLTSLATGSVPYLRS